jgi:hypothetical protein
MPVRHGGVKRWAASGKAHTVTGPRNLARNCNHSATAQSTFSQGTPPEELQANWKGRHPTIQIQHLFETGSEGSGGDVAMPSDMILLSLECAQNKNRLAVP